jgi:Ca2+-binding RTX toxin-like protein
VANSYYISLGGPAQLFIGVTGRIEVFGNDGNDIITIDSRIAAQTLLDGGIGDDIITGGRGADVITGGPGNNTLNGGTGTNTLVEAGDFNMTLVSGTSRLNGSLTTTGNLNDVLIKNTFSNAQLTAGSSGDTLDASAFVGNTTLIGGDGNDTLKGGTKNNILVGNAGDDTLIGGAGKNVLIGGLGTDTITGGNNQDLLIGGATSFDNDLTALNGIMLEWGSGTAYATKIKHLLGTLGGGKNGTVYLNTTTVSNDSQPNILTGAKGLDWFFRGTSDNITDLNNGGTETVTTLP